MPYSQPFAKLGGQLLLILFIDNHSGASATIASLLKAGGHHAVEVKRARKNANVLHHLCFDACVVDIGDWEKADIDFLLLLKEVQPDIHVIATSASLKSLPHYWPPLAEAFLAKPFGLDELSRAVSDAIRLDTDCTRLS